MRTYTRKRFAPSTFLHHDPPAKASIRDGTESANKVTKTATSGNKAADDACYRFPSPASSDEELAGDAEAGSRKHSQRQTAQCKTPPNRVFTISPSTSPRRSHGAESLSATLAEQTISDIKVRSHTPAPCAIVQSSTTSSSPSPRKRKLRDRLCSKQSSEQQLQDAMSADPNLSDQANQIFPTEFTTSLGSAAASQRPQATDARPNVENLAAGISSSKGSRTLRATYATASRTVLQDDEPEQAMDEPFEMIDSSRGRRAQALFDNVRMPVQYALQEDLDPAESSQKSQMQSYRELREAGARARRSKDLETSLDEICTLTSPRRQQKALLDFMTKLMAASQNNASMTHGLEHKLPRILDYQWNEHCRSLILVFINIVLVEKPAATQDVFVEHPSRLKLFEAGLKDTTPLLSQIDSSHREGSAIPADKAGKLYRMLCSAPWWLQDKPEGIDGRLLSLNVLQRLLSFPAMDKSLRTDVARLIFAHAAEILDAGAPAEMSHARYLLATLEPLAVPESDEVTQSVWPMTIVKSFCDFLARVPNFPAEDRTPMWILTLRVCLNLSNGSFGTCQALSTQKGMAAVLDLILRCFGSLSQTKPPEDADDCLDMLVLSLGFLINLAEKSESARLLIVNGQGPCANQVRNLLALFRERLSEAFEVTSELETRLNVPFGYLAVLLVYLSATRNFGAQYSADEQRLLADTAEKFLTFYRLADQAHTKDTQERELRSLISPRIASLINALKMGIAGQ